MEEMWEQLYGERGVNPAPSQQDHRSREGLQGGRGRVGRVGGVRVAEFG